MFVLEIGNVELRVEYHRIQCGVLIWHIQGPEFYSKDNMEEEDRKKGKER